MSAAKTLLIEDASDELHLQMLFDQAAHRVQKGAGHYGVFNGSKWRNEIQPKLAKFILERFSVEEEREILRGHGLKVVGGREQGVA